MRAKPLRSKVVVLNPSLYPTFLGQPWWTWKIFLMLVQHECQRCAFAGCVKVAFKALNLHQTIWILGGSWFDLRFFRKTKVSFHYTSLSTVHGLSLLWFSQLEDEHNLGPVSTPNYNRYKGSAASPPRPSLTVVSTIINHVFRLNDHSQAFFIQPPPPEALGQPQRLWGEHPFALEESENRANAGAKVYVLFGVDVVCVYLYIVILGPSIYI